MGWESPRDLAGLAPQVPGGQVTGKEGVTDRRHFIGGVGASAVAAVWVAFDAFPERVRAADAEQELENLRAAGPRLQSLSDLHGGTSALRTLAENLAARADSLVQARLSSSALTNQAQSLAARFSMTAGWLYLDAGNQNVARLHWQHALYQAQLADDLETEVYALSSLSNQATFRLRRAEEGLLLAQRALVAAGGWATPKLKSLLLMREAAARAARGEGREFDRVQQRAASLLPAGPADDAPAWTAFYDRAEFDGLRALGYDLLGDLARAGVLYRDVVSRVPTHLQLNRLVYTTLLAKAIVGTGDVVGGLRFCRQFSMLLPRAVRSELAGMSGRSLLPLERLEVLEPPRS